jgi:hypothetical protein
MRISRPYDNQLLTWLLLVSAVILVGVGMASSTTIASPDPCLPAAQQESGTALTMPLTYIELGSSAFAVFLYWLLIQKQWFFGQNWLRWTLSSATGCALGMVGIWGLSSLTAPCAKEALSNAGGFGIGPILPFGNFFFGQFWNARAVEVCSWILASTLLLWGTRYAWLNISLK